MKRWPICSARQPWHGEPMQAVHPKVTTMRLYRTLDATWPLWSEVRCESCGATLTFAVNNWRDFKGER